MIREHNLGRYLQMDPRWVFSLCAHLWRVDPDTDALRVLTTYQAVEEIPDVVSISAGLAATFFPGRPLWAIPTALIAGHILGLVAVRAGVLTPLRHCGLLGAGRFWSSVPPLPFHFCVLLVLAVTSGWAAALMWLAGYIGSIVASSVLEFYLTRLRISKTALPITASGANFIHAYRFHAARLGIPAHIELTAEELESDMWRDCFEDFATKCPQGAANFCGTLGGL